MRRAALLRILTLALAFVHTFPARKHVAAFLAVPSWTEGWQGFGAGLAIVLYLLPVAVQTRGLQLLWRRRATLALVWFAAPLRAQARILGWLVRFFRASPGPKAAPLLDSV